MKKIFIVCLLTLMLVGCSNSNVTISDENKQIWVGPDKTFVSKDLFKMMKSQDYTTNVIASIEKTFAEKEGIDISKLEKEAEEEYQEVINSGYESYISYYYGSKEAYIQNTVQGKIVNELKAIIIKEKLTELEAEYLPYKAEIVYFNTREEAQKVIDDYKAGFGTFAFIASENGYNGVVENKVYTDTSDLPIEVKEAVMNSTAIDVLDIIQTSLASNDSNGNSVVTPRYYVVNITERELNKFKDEFIEYCATNLYTADDTINDFSKKYKVKIHDQETYNLLKDKYPGFEY